MQFLKLFQKKNHGKDYLNVDRVFKVAIFLFSIIGFIGCIVLYFLSDFIANKIIEIPEATLSLKVLSPAIFFVSITSVVRGFCNGQERIDITAKSQFFEQILKTTFTIILVECVSKVSNNNTVAMASIANFATTLATFFSLIYISKKYFELRIKVNNFSLAIHPLDRIYNIIHRVLEISIPMTIGAILTSLGKNVDSITVVRILKNIIGEENSIIKYGILSSKVDIIMMLPLSFNIAIATSLIPEISKQKALNNLDGILKNIELSIFISLFVGIPATFGLFYYSEAIFNLLFPKAKSGYELLSLASIGLTFSLLTQTINGILQGLGDNKTPIYAAVIGLVAKILLNIILIPINIFLEKGAIIGNIASSVMSFCIVYTFLKKRINIKISILNLSFKPILCSIIMIVISKSLYNYLFLKNINSNIITIISLIIAVIIYIISAFVTKMINKTQITESLENTVNK